MCDIFYCNVCEMMMCDVRDADDEMENKKKW